MGMWTKGLDEFYSKKYRKQVEDDIQENNLQIKVKDFHESFVKFCCIERVHFEADIIDELESYLNRKRMYITNVKKWKSISKFVFKRDNYTCSYCKQIGGKLEVDHIVPFSKGGSDDFENLTTSCLRCNRQKKDKSVQEFNNWKLKL